MHSPLVSASPRPYNKVASLNQSGDGVGLVRTEGLLMMENSSCVQCGSQVGEQDRFCTQCGNPLDGTERMLRALSAAWLGFAQRHPNTELGLLNHNKNMVRDFLEGNPTADCFADCLDKVPVETVGVFMEEYQEVDAFQEPFALYMSQTYRAWSLNPFHPRVERAFSIQERVGFWKAALHYAIFPNLPHPWGPD